MSERMSNERAIEILEKERDALFDEIEHYSIGGVSIDKSARELLEALEIAIESIEQTQKIKDITIANYEQELVNTKNNYRQGLIDLNKQKEFENE